MTADEIREAHLARAKHQNTRNAEATVATLLDAFGDATSRYRFRVMPHLQAEDMTALAAELRGLVELLVELAPALPSRPSPAATVDGEERAA